MKIALITNKDHHHKYYVSELYKNNNITLIIHPVGLKQSFFSKFNSKRFLYYGKINVILKILSLIYGKLFTNGMSRSISNAEKKYFSQYEGDYKNIPKSKIVDVETVNSDKAIRLIKENNIDVICFLGGDIAKKEFINSAKLCLNYHNGISPLYNGNKTNFHAVSDFRPNFTGGTLMKMNQRIDGGEILMHYLCPIEDRDKAVDLYMKGIIGAVKLYNLFLKNPRLNIEGVKQVRSFKYVRNIDWTILNDIRLKKFNEYGRMKIYKREEKIIDYTVYKYNKEEFYGKILKEILG